MVQNRVVTQNLPKTDARPGSGISYQAVIPLAIKGCHHLRLAISTTANGLSGIDYVQDIPFQDPETSLAREVVWQLENYFQDPGTQFDLPLDLSGTDFQQRLWLALCEVPVGSVDTYGQLATRLNSGAQAIGQACRRNPVPLVVPCHRIVSRQGMGGYAGQITGEKLQIKQALLAHEGMSRV
jgi:methylated-DNA-[protein]-cysteine S-methyltransferase